MSSIEDDDRQLRVSRSHPVHEDMSFQCTTWRMERYGWVALMLLAALALAGLFAEGPLSSATAVSENGRLEIRYDRFARNGAPMRMAVIIHGEGSEEAVLRFSEPLTDTFSIETIRPAPAEERGGPQGDSYVFRAEDRPLTLRFMLRPEKSWLHHGEISLDGEPPIPLTFFIYP